MTNLEIRRLYGSKSTLQYDKELYETPEEAVRRLLTRYHLKEPIWEPACGRGGISKVLESEGYKIKSSDLYDHGFGENPRDFFRTRFKCNTIITNPPFSTQLQFCHRALEILDTPRSQSFMILRLDFLSSQGRREFLEKSPLKEVLVFSKRIGFITPNKSTPRKAINYAWFVWEIGYWGRPQIGWI